MIDKTDTTNNINIKKILFWAAVIIFGLSLIIAGVLAVVNSNLATDPASSTDNVASFLAISATQINLDSNGKFKANISITNRGSQKVLIDQIDFESQDIGNKVLVTNSKPKSIERRFSKPEGFYKTLSFRFKGIRLLRGEERVIKLNGSTKLANASIQITVWEAENSLQKGTILRIGKTQ